MKKKNFIEKMKRRIYEIENDIIRVGKMENKVKMKKLMKKEGKVGDI